METVVTDRVIRETGCMLYLRMTLVDNNFKVYLFKHDEFRCDFQIFTGNCHKEIEEWLSLPISTAASY